MSTALKSKKKSSSKHNNDLRLLSKWTLIQAVDGNKHFEIVAVRKELVDDVEKKIFQLKNIVTKKNFDVSLEDLRGGEKWIKGWR